MSIKWIGAILIVATSFAVGSQMAMSYIRQERQLEQLLQSFHYIKCELKYRLTPLPAQFDQCAKTSKGPVALFYQNLYGELSSQIAPDVQYCVQASIRNTPSLAQCAVTVLQHFGKTLGNFDLNGQLLGLEDTYDRCQEQLQQLKAVRPMKVRNCQTLSLCVGAALVILFI